MRERERERESERAREKRAKAITLSAFRRIGKTLYAVKKVKVMCTLVQALRFCTGHTAHRESRGIALIFNDQRH